MPASANGPHDACYTNTDSNGTNNDIPQTPICQENTFMINKAKQRRENFLGVFFFCFKFLPVPGSSTFFLEVM